MTISCTKKYIDLPFAHRQPNHTGHCALIHGHSWGFDFTFATAQLDECGFVIDFGKLGWLKNWLNRMFDHTLVLNETDPCLGLLKATLVDSVVAGEELGNGVGAVDLAKIIEVPDCSCEGLATYVLKEVGNLLYTHTNGRVSLVQVTVHEDSKNSASAFSKP